MMLALLLSRESRATSHKLRNGRKNKKKYHRERYTPSIINGGDTEPPTATRQHTLLSAPHILASTHLGACRMGHHRHPAQQCSARHHAPQAHANGQQWLPCLWQDKDKENGRGLLCCRDHSAFARHLGSSATLIPLISASAAREVQREKGEMRREGGRSPALREYKETMHP